MHDVSQEYKVYSAYRYEKAQNNLRSARILLENGDYASAKRDSETFLCGKEDTCENCISAIEKPGIYPVYYTDEAYNATKFGLASLLWERQEKHSPQLLNLSYKAVVWEAERISLIKKECHKYDEEWRMIRPSMSTNRIYIKMRPCKVLLGMRMPKYERALVTAAAKCAGISIIEELYINDLDLLDSKAI